MSLLQTATGYRCNLSSRPGMARWLGSIRSSMMLEDRLSCYSSCQKNEYLIPKGDQDHTHCRSPEPRGLLLILLQVPVNCQQPLDKGLPKAELSSWKESLEIIRGWASCVSKGHVDLCLGIPVVEPWCGAALPHHPGKPPVPCSAVRAGLARTPGAWR